VRSERRGVAALRFADVEEQCGAQALHQLRGDDVAGFLGAADPLPQVIDVQFLGHAFFSARALSFWPMAGTAP